MKKTLIRISGIIILITGIAGLFIPLIPGWGLIFLALSILKPSEKKKSHEFA